MSIFKASAFFALGTLLSRLFGIVRESTIAGVFGASLALDAFIVANRIPNMLREMLAEGALGSSFTKVFAELWERERERALRLLRDSLYVCTLLSLVICTLGVWASPLLVSGMTMLSAAGRDATLFHHETLGLTRLLFPFIGLMTVGAIASGALHQKGRFFTSAVSPIALNLGYLIGALVFAELLARHAPPWLATAIAGERITGLALGVLLGGALQLFVQLYAIWHAFLKQALALPMANPWTRDIRRVFTLMIPMVLASSAGQINVLVNTNFAASLEAGAVVWLTFSFRLLQLPIGLFAVAIGSVALPSLTRAVGATRRGEAAPERVGSELALAVEWMLWLMAPCCVFFLASALPLTQLIYQHDAYTPAAAEATAEALYFYSFSLIGYGLIKVLTAFYYAVEKTAFAMQVSLVGIVVNYAANWVLVDVFGHKGLAMTSSLVLSLNALLLMLGVRREGICWPAGRWRRGFLCLGAAFALSYLGQSLIMSGWDELGLARRLPFKLGLALELLLTASWVGLIFAAFALIYLRKSPGKALALLQERRRKPPHRSAHP